MPGTGPRSLGVQTGEDGLCSHEAHSLLGERSSVTKSSQVLASVAQWVGAQSRALEGHGFSSQSRHTPGAPGRHLLGGRMWQEHVLSGLPPRKDVLPVAKSVVRWWFPLLASPGTLGWDWGGRARLVALRVLPAPPSLYSAGASPLLSPGLAGQWLRAGGRRAWAFRRAAQSSGCPKGQPALEFPTGLVENCQICPILLLPISLHGSHFPVTLSGAQLHLGRCFLENLTGQTGAWR